MKNYNDNVLNNPDIGTAAKNLGFSYNELCEYFYLLNQLDTVEHLSKQFETDVKQIKLMIEQGKHGAF